MCGILGAVDFEIGTGKYSEALQKGLNSIAHRGPDGSRGITVYNSFLGHNRLSIIDLSSEADQPMKSVNSDAYILYNGEIYNYSELREDLKNVKLRTRSDTEVLLEGYLNYGTDFFRKLRGIYAFAIFDFRGRHRVILGRDPSGVKPLYIYSSKNFHVFGSEIKALKAAVRSELNVDEDVLKTFLNLGYCPEPYTIYKEIGCLEPGCFAELEKDIFRKSEIIKYDFEKKNTYNVIENTERVEAKLRKAVERNLTADVEVAVALSGGIDSSLIYYYANSINNNIRGLTVRADDEEYNEAEIAKVYSVTVNGNLDFVDIESDLNLETLERIFLNFDQPYADSSAINVYFLTKATGKITKVLIGGDGGDELFNGYPSQTWLTYLYRYGKNRFMNKTGRLFLNSGIKLMNSSGRRTLKRFSDLWNDRPEEILYDWHSWFPRKTVYHKGSPFLFNTDTGVELYNSIFRKDIPAEFGNRVVFDYFRKQMLSDYLRKTDMMSMLNGVEYRVPFLDEDLSDFSLKIPFKQKSSLKVTKKILRSIHGKIYPSETGKAAKRGFTIPLDNSLNKDEFGYIKESLLKNGNITHQYIKKDYIEYLFEGLKNRNSVANDISRAGIYQRILMLYSLSIWYERK